MARNLPEPRRTKSTLSKLDDALLVVVVAAVALAALQVVSWVIGTIFFLVKIAVALTIGAVVVAWFRNRHGNR